MAVLFYRAENLIAGLASRIELHGVAGNRDIGTVSAKVANVGTVTVGTKVKCPIVVDTELPSVCANAGTLSLIHI